MTKEQRSKLEALDRCTMLPGSWDKRFIRDMKGQPADFVPSEKQSEMIEKLYHRYRRQLAAHVGR